MVAACCILLPLQSEPRVTASRSPASVAPLRRVCSHVVKDYSLLPWARRAMLTCCSPPVQVAAAGALPLGKQKPTWISAGAAGRLSSAAHWGSMHLTQQGPASSSLFRRSGPCLPRHPRGCGLNERLLSWEGCVALPRVPCSATCRPRVPDCLALERHGACDKSPERYPLSG
ncbi:hypothetical protein NDU88_008820 [Pleurodeles waltl]|uniref:Secreted protein n=1 Tax=Pleurodeles waltl TaxID=8319 RepID=A0AAV7PX98_PLEWA|nr:hypothetical protein NDU88_008820 [Pleurodeles waltl]